MSQNTAIIPSAVYDPILRMPICKSRKCNYAIPRDYIRNHLRKVHGLEKEAIDEIVIDLDAESEASVVHPNPVLREKYMETTDKDAKLEESLPKHHSLATFSAWKCTSCKILLGTATTNTPPFHSCDSGAKNKQQLLIKRPVCLVTAQSVYGGNKRRLFHVTDEYDKQSAIVLLPNPRSSCNAERSFAVTTSVRTLNDSERDANKVVRNPTWNDSRQSWVSSLIEYSTRLETIDNLDLNMSPHESEMDPVQSELQTHKTLSDNDLTMESAAFLTRFTHLPEEQMVKTIVYKYMMNAHDVSTTNIYVNSHTFLGHPMRMNISTSTIQKYATRATNLILFLRRSVTTPLYTNLCELYNEELRADIGVVNSVLNSPDTGKRAATFEEAELQLLLLSFHNILEKLFFCPTTPTNTIIPLFIAARSVQEISRLKNQARVRHATEDVYTHSRAHNDNPSSPTHKTYRMMASTDLSHVLSSLQFLAHCYVVTQVYLIQSPGSASEVKNDNGEPRADLCTGDRWRSVHSATSNTKDNGIRYIRHALTLCNRVNRTKRTLDVRFNICPQHTQCAYIDSVMLSVPSLSSAIKHMQRKGWSILRAHLLQGVTLTESFWSQMGTLKDTLRERTPHFSFTLHPENAELFAQCRTRIIESTSFTSLAIATPQAEALEQGSLQFPNGNFKFPVQAAKDYIVECDKLHRMLFTLVHLTSGSPARITEWAPLKLRNTNHQLRNVYITSGGYVTFITTYHKSQKLKDGEQKFIARFPDAVTSGLLVVYIAIVRPLELLIRQQLHNGAIVQRRTRQPAGASSSAVGGQSNISPSPPHLFLHVGTGAPARVLRHWFATTMEEHGIPLNVSMYRHYHVGIVDNFIESPSDACKTRKHDSDMSDDDENDGDEERIAFDTGVDDRRSVPGHRHRGNNNSALALQRAHTSDTAQRIYARTSAEHTTMSAQELSEYLFASYQHHKLLCLPHGPPSPLQSDDLVTGSTGSTPTTMGSNKKNDTATNEKPLPLPTPTAPVSAESERIAQNEKMLQTLTSKVDVAIDLLQKVLKSNYTSASHGFPHERSETKIELPQALLTMTAHNPTRAAEKNTTPSQLVKSRVEKLRNAHIDDNNCTKTPQGERETSPRITHCTQYNRVTLTPTIGETRNDTYPLARKLCFDSDGKKDEDEERVVAGGQKGHQSQVAHITQARDIEMLQGAAEVEQDNTAATHVPNAEEDDNRPLEYVQIVETPATVRATSVKGLGIHITDTPTSSMEEPEEIGPETQRPTKRRRLQANSEQVVKALRTVTGVEDAEFRSDTQEREVLAVLNATNDRIVIQATGSGKSLLFLIPALLHTTRTTVLICPLLALQHDLLRRAKAAHVDAVPFEERESHTARLVIIAVEHTSTAQYTSYILRAVREDRLHCFVLDEAHSPLLSASYRESMAVLHARIRPDPARRIPLVALTATCPPTLLRKIAEFAGIRMSKVTISRSATNRTNIGYIWLRVSGPQHMFGRLIVEKAQHIADDTDLLCDVGAHKFIVYAPTRHRVETLCRDIRDISRLNNLSIDVSFYHALVDEGERTRTHNAWLAPSIKRMQIICATNAFGCGIDCPTVRGVFHADTPATMIDYAQESGRAGRDGRPAYSIVLSNGARHEWRLHNLTEQNRSIPTSSQLQSVTDVRDFWPCNPPTGSDSTCRRFQLSAYVDGPNSGVNCLQQRGNMLCDCCARRVPKEFTLRHLIPDTVIMSTTPSPTLDYAEAYIQDDSCEFNPTRQNQSENKTNRHLRRTKVRVAQPPNTTGPLGKHNKALMLSPIFKHDIPAMRHVTIAAELHSACAVCSISKRKIIQHDNTTELTTSCYNAECYGCGSKNHRRTECPVRNWGFRRGTCRVCNLGRHGGSFIHLSGTFGRESCTNRTLIHLATIAWETEEIKKDMVVRIPELANISSDRDFLQYIVNYSTTGETVHDTHCGLAAVVYFLHTYIFTS